jgi:hypothetical protein
MLEWDEPLTGELIAHPGLLPYLEALLPNPDLSYPDHSRFYLEHEYTM